MMDLRWGIQDQSRIDHTTLDFCLQEIDNCRNNSVGPSFVLFLGQKYGYQPIPATIVDTEFDTIRDTLERVKANVSLLDTWYKKDTNRIPAQYQLQPISAVLKNFENQYDKELREKDEAEWNVTFQSLQSLLRRGVELAADFKADAVADVEKYFISVTEWEINRGMMEHPSPNTHCLLFERHIQNLKNCLTYDRVQRFVDMVPDTKMQDMTAVAKLNRMKSRKLNLLVDSVTSVQLNVNWNDPTTKDPNDNAEYLKEFCASFIRMMKSSILQTVGGTASIVSDSYVREIVQHLTMCRSRCDTFLGRETEIAKIRERVLDNCQQMIVIHGSSGTGKTSVMAKVTSLLGTWFPDPVVVVRFLGTTARSSSIRLVLGSICWQIATAYNHDVQQIPSDFPSLVKYFLELLENISTESQPLVMILDSLDQLSPSHHAHNLLWIPRVLPANVRLIVSTLPEEYDLLKTLRGMVSDEGRYVEILPLGQCVGLDVLHSWLREHSRCLTAEQNAIMEKALAECSLPLYMKLIFDKVIQWRSYSLPEETILEPTVKGVIHSLFDRVEKYYGKIFVKHVLSYMTASKYGLSDVEMEDLLSLDDVVLDTVFSFWIPPVRRIPPVLLPRLYNEMRPYITLREANGQIVYYWYHRQFIDVVNQRYLLHLQHRQYIHSILADYFMGKWGGGIKKPYRLSMRLMGLLNQKEPFAHADRKVPIQPLIFGQQSTSGPRLKSSGLSASPRYNLRKLSELPHHLIESKRFAELREEVLFNYHWLYTKLKATSLQDVLSDFRCAIEAGVNDKATQTVLSALRIGGSVLTSNPETLAFDLLARLVSYYDQCKYVSRLLQQCDLQSLEQSALLPVYQCYEAPRGMLLYILDHVKTVFDIIFSRSTNELICAAGDRSIGFWDLAIGERTRAATIPLIEEAMSLMNMKLYLSSDDKYLACDPGSNGSPVFIYDVKSAQLLYTVGQKSPLLKRTFQAGNLLCRGKSIINVRTGVIVGDLDELIPAKKFVVCNISSNEKFIVFGENDKIKVFDIVKKQCVSQIACSSPPSVIAISGDSTKAFIGFTTSCLLKVLDINPASASIGKLLKEFNYLAAFPQQQAVQGNKYFQEVAELALLPARSDVVLLNIKRCILIVLNVEQLKTSPVLLDINNNKDIQAEDSIQFYDTALLSDNMHVFAVARCGNLLCVWNASNGQILTILKPHSAGKFVLAVSGENFGKPMVAVSSLIQAAVKVWDLSKTQEVEIREPTIYECPIKQVAAAVDRGLLFVKHGKSLYRSDGYKFIDHFGIDVWNLQTEKSHVCVPFHQYGRLLQMEVSKNASHLGLLLQTRSETYLAVLGLRPEVPAINCLPHWSGKSFVPSPNWHFIVTYAEEETEKSVKLWEMRSATEIMRFEQARGPIFTYDGLSMLLLLDTEVVVVKLSGLPRVTNSFECNAIALKPIPNQHQCVMALLAEDGGYHSSVTIWNFVTEIALITVNNVSPGGIRDISKDGRLMIDNYLQVFDVETGQMVCGLAETHKDADHSFVRLTHDGLYAVVVDSTMVTIYRMRDRRVVARTSTHVNSASLELFDFGYLHAIGCEDGHISITKLVTGNFAEKIDSVCDRTRQLLNFPTCSDDSVEKLDKFFRRPMDLMTSDDLPVIKAVVYSALSNRANPPVIISLRQRVPSQGSLVDVPDCGTPPRNVRQLVPEKRRKSSSSLISWTKYFRRSREYNVSPSTSLRDIPTQKETKTKTGTFGRGKLGKDTLLSSKSNSMHDIYSTRTVTNVGTTRSVLNVGTMVLSLNDMAARSQAAASTLPPTRPPQKKTGAARALIDELFQPTTNGTAAKDASIHL